VKLRLVVLAVAVLIAWGLKRHYADARAEDLAWILAPTSRLAGAMAGTTFVLQPGEGYFSREHLFVIAKPCAGINFMVAAFGMLVLALLHHVGSPASAARVLGASLVASYGAAVLVNAARIVVALWLAAHPIGSPALGAAEVHRLEGITVYFGGLVLLYELVRWLDRRGQAFHPAALPLASYYAITLALPVAGGVPLSGAFLEHAPIVLLVPLLVVLGACAVRAAAARWLHFANPRSRGPV